MMESMLLVGTLVFLVLARKCKSLWKHIPRCKYNRKPYFPPPSQKSTWQLWWNQCWLDQLFAKCGTGSRLRQMMTIPPLSSITEYIVLFIWNLCSPWNSWELLRFYRNEKYIYIVARNHKYCLEGIIHHDTKKIYANNWLVLRWD